MRRIGESILALGRSRFELFTVEWQEEKLRLLDLCLWFVAVTVLALAGLLVAIVTLAIWLWQVAGYAGLIGLSFATLGGATIIGCNLRRKIQTGPTPFQQTVAEFRKDGECLRPKN